MERNKHRIADDVKRGLDLSLPPASVEPLPPLPDPMEPRLNLGLRDRLQSLLAARPSQDTRLKYKQWSNPGGDPYRGLMLWLDLPPGWALKGLER